MIRVVIIDDHPIVRSGLRAALAASGDVDVVGDAASAEAGMALIERERPEVALVDLHLGNGPDGITVLEAIAASDLSTRTLVVTAFDNTHDITAALEAGASGYLLKDVPETELAAAIHAAAEGHSPLSPQVAGRILARNRRDPDALTDREHEVLMALADGSDNATVARRLYISQATVKSHLTHIFTKLAVSTRTGALAEARRRGLLR